MQKETNYVGSGRTMTFSWGTKQCLSIKKANFDLLPVDKYGNVKIDVVVRKSPDKFDNDLSVVENTYVPKMVTEVNSEDDLQF
jgi:hypothetical protein